MRGALLAAALLLAGCAYNGMYHARRLSGDAEKAERDGRTIDANAFWGQVTVKAETLLARYPDSKYSTEARLLLGRAHAHLNDCTAARPMSIARVRRPRCCMPAKLVKPSASCTTTSPSSRKSS